jgi:hypothetical protein
MAADIYILKVTNGGDDEMHDQVMLEDIVGEFNAVIAVWTPPALNNFSGITPVKNTGCGAVWPFTGAANDEMSASIDLYHNGLDYDGADLTLELRGAISAAPVASDDVKIEINYAFTKDGDNIDTLKTLITDVTVVDGKTANLQFTITDITLTGVTGADGLQISVLRRSSGAGEDAYDGDYNVKSLRLVKV